MIWTDFAQVIIMVVGAFILMIMSKICRLTYTYAFKSHIEKSSINWICILYITIENLIVFKHNF